MKNTFVNLEEITKYLPDTVVVVNEAIEIVAVNDQIKALFGYDPEEVVGQKLSMLVPYRYRTNHDQHFKEYLMQPSARRMGTSLNLFGLTKDGTEIDVDVALAPVEVKGERLVIATIRDISDKKDLERKLLKKYEQLEIINDELEKFAYLIAHDLKSPLINIHALLHLLKKELPKDQSNKLQEYATAMQNSLELMTNMISGVSAYSKAGTGQGKEESINLNSLLADIKKLVHIPNGGHLEVQENMPCVSGNKIKLQQMFTNLVNNAFKHNNSKTPFVLVQATVSGTSCQIIVSDNGPGVPMDLRKRIFRLFDKGNSKRPDSQGIGLAIVKKIVEERGGTIKVEPSTLGGASFIVNWPGVVSEPVTSNSSKEGLPSDTEKDTKSCPFITQIN